LVDTTRKEKMVSMEEQKKRRTRRKFTDEYKARAVRLVLKEGQKAAQVARDLGLIESVLHSWVRQAKIDRGMGPAGALRSETSCRACANKSGS
jgi:transposase